MASLTGNKIKDTYSALLKVGDNGAIDGTAQALSDGAGNALGLTLTNTGVIVSTTSGTIIGTSSTNVISNGMMADDAIAAAEIVDNSVGADELNVSGDGSVGEVLTSDGDGTFSWAAATTGDITGVTAGTGLDGGGTSGTVTVNLTAHTGDVTGTTALTIAAQAVENSMIADDAVGADELAADAVVTASVVDDAVTFAKLENRYTAKVDITTYTGAVSIDWAAGTTFKMGSSLTGATEFDFTNFKQGQVITFYNLTGSETITFDSDAGTSETFNKVGAVDYDGTTTNMIQVECIDDSTNAIFNYSVAAYTSDVTPS